MTCNTLHLVMIKTRPRPRLSKSWSWSWYCKLSFGLGLGLVQDSCKTLAIFTKYKKKKTKYLPVIAA
ncbi:Uncharacterized protein FWK35_00012017 [Aphis craccivora]|uniref:Uncharacterized protein n=1 Tax=Aphis craccivora TaxID=307492 RepID=A0A6G0YHL0_APHCR|nr:Uncharacterized protein FWK35_00012017 [Aphis craccivora]